MLQKGVIANLKYGGRENTIKKSPTENNSAESIIPLQHGLYPLKMKFLQIIIVTLIAMISPMLTHAQLPNLGTSIDFALFTTVGALDNTGTSNIIGDIGTNNGAITGFGAPTVVTGNVEIANAVTAQCAIDVQTVYNELFATTPTVLGHTPAFGSGETLAPGVYFIGAAGSVAGNLTLDAQGDPNAIFIFQFGGAFTTGASTNVNLINGASACNVFWIAEGAIAMAALTNMKGTIISNNGAISMGAGGILEGRMLSTAGAASVYDALITLPACTVLPISLLSFTGSCDKQNIVLQWSTASEINNDYFTIERSPDGKNWDTVGTVIGGGNSSSQLDYTLTDITDITHNEVITYYRLKQTDFNGDYKYEAIIGINKCEDNSADHFTIYPNPSEGKLELFYNCNSSEINSIDVINTQGQKIYSSIDFQSTFDLSNNVPGIYFMSIQKNSEIICLKFIISN